MPCNAPPTASVVRGVKLATRNWTVLLYANGNNDLQPEIGAAVRQLMATKWDANINVVVQWASAPLEMIRILRPLYDPEHRQQHWSGVRRYLLKNGQPPQFLEDLGLANMAEPATLKEFIYWGMTNLSADHYMLIVAGHGAGLAGLMPDYTQRCPCMMSIGGLKYALDQGVIATGGRLDILLLDTCYMNMVEIIYQLGSGHYAPKFIIAPGRTPLQGLPYQKILTECSAVQRLTPLQMISSIMQVFNSGPETKKAPIAVIKPQNFCLISIKKIISLIGTQLLEKSLDIPRVANLPLPLLIETLGNAPDIKIKLYARLLERSIKGLVLPWEGARNSLCIYLPTVPQFRYTAHYYQALKFSHRNRWLNYIAGKEFSLVPPQGGALSPYLPLDGVINLISAHNPGLPTSQISNIINRLGWAHCPKLEQQKEQ